MVAVVPYDLFKSHQPVCQFTESVSVTQSTILQLHHLGEVFRKDHTLSLTPQGLYDCGIDLLPGMLLPTNLLYSILQPEWEVFSPQD